LNEFDKKIAVKIIKTKNNGRLVIKQKPKIE
jgi:hypothetical protein